MACDTCFVVLEVSHVWKAGRRGLDGVKIGSEPLDRFGSVLPIDEYQALLQTAKEAKTLLGKRIVWNITSTARGGGVAEMLTSLLPLARGAGVDARWLVLRAEEDFFGITKRIHNRLHGALGDGGDLGPVERAQYGSVLFELGGALDDLVSPHDLVILHDPQTAGIAPALRRKCRTVWRCHVGVDVPDAIVRSAWRFLSPYLEAVDAYVFTRRAYAFEDLRPEKVAVIPPSIDIFAPKNQQLTAQQTSGILRVSNLVQGRPDDVRFKRLDGSIGTVARTADLSGGMPVPESVPIVTQISRWDRLKDPIGLVKSFAAYVAPWSDAHLVVAGPAVGAVKDDPEGSSTLDEVRRFHATFAAKMRERIHLVCLPMEDAEENAAIVNALQRRAAVVVQKSLAEGFGLTVAEAMWKERPIVASRVGGIQDQLSHGESGLLVEPTDLQACGRAMGTLLSNKSFAEILGRAAHARCRQEYLAPKHLRRYVKLFETILSDR